MYFNPIEVNYKAIISFRKINKIMLAISEKNKNEASAILGKWKSALQRRTGSKNRKINFEYEIANLHKGDISK